MNRKLTCHTRMESLGTQVIVRDGQHQIRMHRSVVHVVAGPDSGRTVECASSRVTIGTQASNDLVLSDDTVSGHHAEVKKRGERYIVRDLGSTNGTWLGDEEVIEAYLAPHKRVQLGNTTIEFRPHVDYVAIDTAKGRFGDLVGRSEEMRSVFGLLERIAPTELVCVILGPTGVGKEMVARAIHDASARRDRPFVVVDCAAVNRQLIESDLFGHERGAFTGAENRRVGAFEQAAGGTLFLDEIGELPLDLQPRLLRVLERREVRPLGAESAIPVDIRVLAATHRDIEQKVENEAFREDLFFRLAEVVVRIPALDARKNDIPLLARALLPSHGLTEEAERHLVNLPYPGNVRQLRNLLRRAAAFAEDGRIDVSGIEQALAVGARPPASTPSTNGSVALNEGRPIREARQRWLDELEPRYVRAVLDLVGGDIEAAADHAGIHKKTFARTLRKHGV